MAGTQPPPGPGAEHRIAKFLRQYPSVPLTVAVGFVSVKGLAWLGAHTRGRPVVLIIGDARPQHFAKASASDRAEALRFLRRPDVEVKNWYRTRPVKATAHLKVWVAHKPNPAVLIGSANLTGAGLTHNWEVMAEVSDDERRRVITNVEALSRQARDAKDRIIRQIESPGQGVTPSKRPALGRQPSRTEQHKRRRSPKQTPARSGCMTSLALILLIAVLPQALILFAEVLGSLL